jgi:hypothetical protein
VPPLGALGVATGVIAIGTVATLRSTIIIITIRTTISTATSTARDKVIGSTIRNTAEMRPMGTGKRRISTAVGRLVLIALEVGPELETAQVAALELVIAPAVVPELGTAQVAVLALPIGPAAVLELETAQAVVLALPIGPAAVPELGTAQVAVLALPIGPAAVLELETAQAAVELQTARAAGPARGHRHAQPVARPKTKWVTAAHRRDQAHLAAEDLAVAAETMHEPAAAEAATAWAAAE